MICSSTILPEAETSFNRNTTIDLERLLRGTSTYTWGKVLNIHTIGVYHVVEFHPWIVNKQSGTIYTGVSDLQKKEFSPYYKGAALGRSGETLDEALLIAMAHKYEGNAHSYAPKYFLRMVQAEKVCELPLTKA